MPNTRSGITTRISTDTTYACCAALTTTVRRYTRHGIVRLWTFVTIKLSKWRAFRSRTKPTPKCDVTLHNRLQFTFCNRALQHRRFGIFKYAARGCEQIEVDHRRWCSGEGLCGVNFFSLFNWGRYTYTARVRSRRLVFYYFFEIYFTAYTFNNSFLKVVPCLCSSVVFLSQFSSRKILSAENFPM